MIVNHFMATMNKKLSDHNFVLSNQVGVLVGHMSFQVKKNYLQPWSSEFFLSIRDNITFFLITVYSLPLEGLHGRVLPQVDLQVGTGSKHDFLTSFSPSKLNSSDLPQGQQETSEGFSRHSAQAPA